MFVFSKSGNLVKTLNNISCISSMGQYNSGPVGKPAIPYFWVIRKLVMKSSDPERACVQVHVYINVHVQSSSFLVPNGGPSLTSLH